MLLSSLIFSYIDLQELFLKCLIAFERLLGGFSLLMVVVTVFLLLLNPDGEDPIVDFYQEARVHDNIVIIVAEEEEHATLYSPMVKAESFP